jgi:hypothetical protein
MARDPASPALWEADRQVKVYQAAGISNNAGGFITGSGSIEMSRRGHF